MSRITVVDNPFVTLWYHTDKKIVHHQIHQFIYGKEFREFLTIGTEQLRKNGATKWLSDDRGNPVVSAEDQAWAQASWVASAIKVGWKHWAVVQPRKLLAQMSMDRVMKEYSELGVNARFFTDADEAMKWLEKQ